MERSQIVMEFQQLRVLLNRRNKLVDQKTELFFDINRTDLFEYRLFCGVKSVHELHRIVLSVRGKSRIWEAGGYSQFNKLEEYVSMLLNRIEKEEALFNKSVILTDVQMQFLTFKVIKIFEDLLISD